MRPSARVAAVGTAVVLLLSGCGGVGAAGPGDDPSYAPSSDRWTPVPAGPLSARHGAVGGWVDDRFVLVGGDPRLPCPPAAACVEPPEPPLADGATFDPASGGWRPIPDAPRPVDAFSGAVVADDQLWVTSSSHPEAGTTVLMSYSPGEETWSEHPLPPAEPAELVATDETVIALGWSDEHETAVDVVLDPATDRWRRLPDDPLGPSSGRGGAWLGDRLLLTATDLVPDPGAGRPSLTRLAALDRTLSRWTVLPDSEIIGGGPTPVAGRVVFPSTGSADGGEVGNWGRSYPDGGIFDPVALRWTPLPEPPRTRSGLAGSLGTVGRRTLVGGHLLDPVTSAWTRLPRAPWPDDQDYQTVLTSPDSILVWGGATTTTNLTSGYLLRP